MGWWDERAGALQRSVRAEETMDDTEHDDAAVRRSVVHAREDIVLIVSLLSSVNAQLEQVRRLLLIVAGAIGAALVVLLVLHLIR